MTINNYECLCELQAIENPTFSKMKNQIRILTISVLSFIPLCVNGSLPQDDPVLIQSKQFFSNKNTYDNFFSKKKTSFQ